MATRTNWRVVVLQLRPERYDRLKAIAQRSGLSMSEILRAVLDRHLDAVAHQERRQRETQAEAAVG